MYTENLSKLNQFIGHKVELSTKDNSITYHYQEFDWNIDDDGSLVLADDTETDCNTYIEMDMINSITNLTEDLYHDVVDIEYGDNRLSVCCAEVEPILPKCYKCGKEIQPLLDTKWQVQGEVNYGSYYDSSSNELSNIVNGLLFCDKCIHNFVGDIDDLIPISFQEIISK